MVEIGVWLFILALGDAKFDHGGDVTSVLSERFENRESGSCGFVGRH